MEQFCNTAFLRLVLLFTVAIQLSVTSTVGLPQRLGDYDGDEQPTVMDITRAVSHLGGVLVLPPPLLPVGDVNQDGAIDENDLQLIVAAVRDGGALPAMADTDNDGIPNVIEPLLGLDPTKRDTDSNGIIDGDEDLDADGLLNGFEVARRSSPLLTDSDGDGWLDEAEFAGFSDPIDPESRPRMHVASRPPVKVIATAPLPVSAGPLAFGTVAASPPVKVVLPSHGLPGEVLTGFVAARPQVSVVLPSATEDLPIALGSYLAAPPVRIVLPSLSVVGESLSGFNLARPPVRVVLTAPSATTDTAPGSHLARPPVTVQIENE